MKGLNIEILKSMKRIKYNGLLLTFFILLLAACKEEEEEFVNPYSGGKAPLGIVTNAQQVPVPDEGAFGTEVSIEAAGLMPHKNKLRFLFNGEEGEIVSVSSTGIKVKVPKRASTGITSFVVDGQLVFGPTFKVLGKISVDPTFVSVNGANNSVLNSFVNDGGNIILMGNFTNYDNKGLIKPINRITRILPNGTWDRDYQAGKGANGTVNGLVLLNGQHYIAGNFSGFGQRTSGVSRITRVSTVGVIDTTEVTTYLMASKFVPKFNGGVNAAIRSLYAFNGKIIATGDFNYYLSRRYDEPTYRYQDSTVIDSVDVRQLVRFNTDGSLDRTWRFDNNAAGYKGLPGKSWPGATGRLSSLMHTDGKILCYGQFKRFDQDAVGYIVRLNPDGTIDNTFNVGGVGADDYINFVSYNEATRSYFAVGRFKSFNGKESRNMVKLKFDGSVDEAFSPKPFTGGLPYFAKLLDDGLTVVAGDFKTYDKASRNGFIILNAAGELAEGYNTLGNVLGAQQRISDVYETRSADNKRALLIMGSFSLFDNQKINNIVRVVLE
jgi:hypothetical protein